ncbi:sulfotransferase [Mangrovimicrobium sediminis]|uniref:Sulfotransferase n=1 Tax=Mangrovimicrobium sediminis TaxID=2562682 RepID=A0A4Z0M1J7_9GAMM|nr:sulfotransferase [Haliea sp. SAOS-164]TGD73563.1 sulfotransferase [Haliea sp. SAOS-164]
MTTRAEELQQQAMEAAALADFGDDSYRDGLERLVWAVDNEAGLTAMGRMGLDMQIVALLSNRLQVEDWYARHPEIDEQEIVAPLIGLGLPRTGSTALSFLLAEDPAVRCIRNWESNQPCPPPETATEATDPRIAQAEAMMARRDEMFPRMKTMLPSTATGPMECQQFMGFDFKSQLFQAFAHIPSYVQWLNHEADLVPTYRYVKRVLKLLQWRCPPTRWRLKNPSHSLFIGALDEVFPDARFWMTHRDVANVIPSVADVYLELTQAGSENVDLHAIGAMTADFCELGMRRMIDFRDAGNESRFFDIHFAPFQADPFPTMEKLYAFLGEEFTDETRERMAAWRRDNSLGRAAVERTPPEAFGLDLDALRQRFGFYNQRFDVA